MSFEPTVTTEFAKSVNNNAKILAKRLIKKAGKSEYEHSVLMVACSMIMFDFAHTCIDMGGVSIEDGAEIPIISMDDGNGLYKTVTVKFTKTI